MDFGIDRADFPSILHSHIYSYGRGLMPLSLTLDSVSDAAMRESCKALHGFVSLMLSDMYEYPQVYHLPLLKLEEFCAGRDLREVKRQFPVKIKGIFSQTSNAAPSYIDLLGRIGFAGKLHGDSIVISAENYKQISKKVSTSVSPISLEKRLEALGRVGLAVETAQEGEVRFTSQKFPKMFMALVALVGKTDKTSKFDGHNFFTLDFRNIESAYKPAPLDYFQPLSLEQRERARTLHEYALKFKLRPNTDTPWKVSYKHKGATVFTIGTDYEFVRLLDIRVMCKDKDDDIAVIDESLKGASQDFCEYAIARLSGCDTCPTSHCSTYASGKFVTVLGKRHQMCGEGRIGFDWREPAEADVAAIMRLIEIRLAIIEAAKK